METRRPDLGRKETWQFMMHGGAAVFHKEMIESYRDAPKAPNRYSSLSSTLNTGTRRSVISALTVVPSFSGTGVLSTRA